MGQGGSIEEDKQLRAVVSKLNKMEVKDIEAVFMELSTKTGEGESVIKQPTWLNRDKFADIFGVTELLVEQLFEAFDRDKNGLVDMQEFVTGIALCLHGSINEKCHLLFKIFNLNGDEGVSSEELSTILTSCLQSANTFLLSTLKSEGIAGYEEQVSSQTGNAMMVSVVVEKIVKDAFRTCDTSRNGKLEIDEFARWVHKNPKLMHNIFVTQCPKPSQRGSSISSEFSVIQMPQEHPNKDCFDEDESATESLTDNTGSEKDQTLLQMASISEEPDPKSNLQTLFPQPTESSDQESFFDTLGNSAADDKQNIKKETALPRPMSEEFLSEQFKVTTTHDAHGGSESNINELPSMNPSHLPQTFHGFGMSESLQSITLSQDSLLGEKTNVLERSPLVTGQISEATSKEVDPESQANKCGTSRTIEFQAQNQTQQTTGIVNERFRDEAENDMWHPLQYQNGIDNLSFSVPEEGANGDDGVFTRESSLAQEEPTFQEEPSLQEEPSIVLGNPSIVQEQPVRNVQQALSENQPGFIDDPPIEIDPVQGKLARGISFWEPSHQTQQHLNSTENAVDQSQLSFPSVLVESFMGDPVKELVAKYLGEQEASKRPTLTVDVKMDESGLRELLAAGCWRAAVDFTTKYLTAHGQGISSVVKKEHIVLTPGLMQVWFVRIALLVKLRMFSSAEAELNAFNDFDAPDMYYQFYPHIYPSKKGSVVPFSLRLLHAELPQHNGRPNVALDRLYGMLAKVTQIIDNLSKGLSEDGGINENIIDEEIQDSLYLWRARNIRIHYSLGNCFLGMKEYMLSVKLFEEVILLEPARKAAILSGIGRIFLQLGDLVTAQRYFKKVNDVAMGDAKTLSMVTMNKGFLSLAQGVYEDSYKQFLSAIKLDPENLAACNNAAVALLFLGKVKEASNLLETMVWRSPARSLHEDILFNLSTVYELETSRALQKKHKLLDLVCKHKGDGFSVQCLKLT